MRALLVLVLITTLSCCGLIWNRTPVAGCGITDSFTGTDVGNGWEVGLDQGGSPGDCLWTIASGEARLTGVNADFGECQNDVMTLGHDMDLGSADQWACVTFGDYSGATHVSQRGVVLRTAAVDDTPRENGDRGHYVTVETSGLATVFTSSDTNALGSYFVSGNGDDGVEMCAQITGTGTGTEFALWFDPTGDDPSAWGDPDYCLAEGAGISYGATNCQDSSWVDWSSTYIQDTGNFVHLTARFNAAAEDGDFQNFDSFRAGGCNTQ